MRTLVEKADLFSPAFTLMDSKTLVVEPGTFVAGHPLDHVVKLPDNLKPGQDYAIAVGDGAARAEEIEHAPSPSFIGGFHVGLDGLIVPASIWDANFRPKCPDPRGMVFVSDFWVDIYFLNTDPDVHGTSKAGVEIADGESEIMLPDGTSKPLTWWNAVTALACHGKQLLSLAEFSVAMQGVEEGKNNKIDPGTTGHTDGLKSAHGIEQATGCMWTWGRDVAPTTPYVGVFGGFWGSARSGARRCSNDDPGDYWIFIGARGRCDHLILG